jgi:hypothetical protein
MKHNEKQSSKSKGKSSDSRMISLSFFPIKVLFLCLFAMVILFFIIVHMTSFSSLTELSNVKKIQSESGKKDPELRSQEELHKRLNELTKAVEESSEKLKSLTLQQQQLRGVDSLGPASISSKTASSNVLIKDATSTTDTSGSTDRPERKDAGNIPSGNIPSESFKDHPILALSDEKLQSIPISEMMSWYGEAEGGGSCSEDFGNKLINKWRGVKQPYCTAKGSPLTESSIDCYLVHQTR